MDEISRKIESLKKMLKEQITLQKEMLDFDECKAYMNVSDSQLYKLTSTRALPYYKPNGKKIYFKRSEVDEFLQSHRISSNEELEAAASEYAMRNKFKI